MKKNATRRLGGSAIYGRKSGDARELIHLRRLVKQHQSELVSQLRLKPGVLEVLLDMEPASDVATVSG